MLNVFADGYGDEEGILLRHGYRRVCYRTNLYLEEGTLKMKIKMLFLSMILSICALAAAPQLLVDGSTTFEQSRAKHFAESLNFTQVAMPTPWMITVLNQEEFENRVHDYGLDTRTAYTILEQRHTFINEYILIYGEEAQVRFTFAHEAGHLICECKSEEKANDIAYRLIR